MPTRDELITSLSRANTAWNSMRGVGRHWRDQTLVTVAFSRFTQALSATGVLLATATGGREGPDDPIIEYVVAVAADIGGRRRRVDVIARRNERVWPDTLVISGDTFWARTGTTITTNGGDPHSSHGGAGIIDLLLPSAVPAGFDLAPTGELEEVAERMCAVATAAPRDIDPRSRHTGSEVFNMIAGGVDFRLSIDLSTGILLKVIKFVDGATAEICEFTEITLDEPLDDALFGPLA